jgi:hypothetical protein
VFSYDYKQETCSRVLKNKNPLVFLADFKINRDCV